MSNIWSHPGRAGGSPKGISVDKITLFSLLRDKAGGNARYRKIFTAPELLTELSEVHHITLVEAVGAVSEYRGALAAQFGRLEVPGTPLSGSVNELFLWPTLRTARPMVSRFSFDEDDALQEEQGEEVDLRRYPERSGNRAVIVAGAGFGKSMLLRVLAHRRAPSAWLPALISLSDLADSDVTVYEFLTEHLNRRLSVSVPWLRYCESGRALLLFDGLDELSAPKRARVLQRIAEFSSRFERVSWLVTVREAGALNAPMSAPILTMAALDSTEVRAFAKAYFAAAKSRADVDDFCAQVARSAELRRLANVPLFLALLINRAIQHPTQPLPQRRSELLEDYIETLLDTESRKPPLVLRTSKDALRAGAERLAFAVLEEGGVEIATRAGRDALRAGGHVNTEDCLADLQVSGLVRCSAHRISFAFPILQEYLAGCHVAQNYPDQIQTRFAGAVSRPWAQALQFALEKCRSSDDVITSLLRLEDDAFGTILRSVGRCIANGAPVSAGVQREVGDRLAALWASGRGSLSRLHDKTGEIIADGFASPLPARVRELLADGYLSNGSSEEILAAANDDELTRTALDKILSRDLSDRYNLYEAQPAVNRIAEEAFARYLERVRSPRTTERERECLASLIGALLGEQISVSARADAARDPALPDDIRLAVHLLLPALTPDAEPLVDRIFHAPALANRMWRGGWMAQKALWHLQEPLAHLRRYLLDADIESDRKRDLLFDVTVHLPVERATAELRSLAEEGSLQEELARAVSLTLAYLGDERAMILFSGQLDTIPLRDVSAWISIASRYRRSGVVVEGIRTLAKRERHEEWARIASSLSFSMQYDVEPHGLEGGGTGKARIRHPAAPEVARLVANWAERSESGSLKRLRLLSHACELEHPATASALRRELDPWHSRLLSIQPAEEERWEYGSALTSALQALSTTPQKLSPSRLKSWAMPEIPNMVNTVVYLLAAHEAQDEALSCMLDLHRELKSGWQADIMVDSIEWLAQRLSVRIVRNDRGALARASG